jgi:hypothetical protein
MRPSGHVMACEKLVRTTLISPAVDQHDESAKSSAGITDRVHRPPLDIGQIHHTPSWP